MKRLAARAAGLAALLLAAGCASSPTPTPPAEVFELDRHNAILYSASHAGSDQAALYVLGSIHQFDRPIVLGPGLEADFGRADALVVEVDIRALDAQDYAELLYRYGVLMPGEAIEDELTPGTLGLLRERMTALGLEPEQQQAVERLKPWALVILLAQQQIAASGAETSLGVDTGFLSRARSDLPVISLETADEQMFALSSISKSAADAMLREALEGGGSQDLSAIQQAWETGDAAALAELTASAMQPEVYDALIVHRNERMAASLAELLEADPSSVLFVVVGAAHVVGERSVPALLRAAGLEVKRER